MKNKPLKVVHQTNKKMVIFRPQDCLNYVEPNWKLFLKDFFHSEGLLPESKCHDNEMRERYRI
jgi:hypothetical protein